MCCDTRLTHIKSQLFKNLYILIKTSHRAFISIYGKNHEKNHKCVATTERSNRPVLAHWVALTKHYEHNGLQVTELFITVLEANKPNEDTRRLSDESPYFLVHR